MNKILFWILIILAIIIFGVVGFVFIEGGGTIKKPAIYIYPEENSHINVKLDINGKIVNDIPKYEKDGWNVFVTKEGLIENKYDYLFYEAKLNKIKLPEEGWVVEYSDLEGWFDKNLITLGLNELHSG